MCAKHVLCGLLLCLAASSWGQSGYDSTEPIGNGMSVVCKSGKYGLVDAAGAEVLPLKYNRISAWGNGLLLLQAGTEEKVLYGLADPAGRIVQPVKYSVISPVNCYGKAIVRLGGKVKNNGSLPMVSKAKQGIMDADGRFLIEPKYRQLFEFARETSSTDYPYGKGYLLKYKIYGAADTLETDCRYLSNYGALIDNKTRQILFCNVIDSVGNLLFRHIPVVMRPSNGMMRFYRFKSKATTIGLECGYCNIETGERFTAVTLDLGNPNGRTYGDLINGLKTWTHGDFRGDVAPVNKGKSVSLIDKTGRQVREYATLEYNEKSDLYRGRPSEKEKWEILDASGIEVASLSGYDDFLFPANNGSCELFGVKKGSRWGYVDRSGRTMIPFEYDAVSRMVYDVCAVRKNGKWGALSPDNSVIFPAEYVSFKFPDECNAQHYWVQKADKLWYHLYRSDGHVAPTGYRDAWKFVDGIALVCPVEMKKASSTFVNRAQLCPPFASSKELSRKKIEDADFGCLIDTEDRIIFDLPVSDLYMSRVLEAIRRRGDVELTAAEKKRILLEVTRENRSYPLHTVIGEEEWDY